MITINGEVLDHEFNDIGASEEEINEVIDEAVNEAILLGYLDDPEIMGSWIKDVAKKVGLSVKKVAGKVKDIIAKVKAKKAESQSLLAPQVSTSPLMTAEQANASSKSIVDQLKNPLVLGGIGVAALVIVLAISKKKRK